MNHLVKIKEAREFAGMSQSDLARKLGTTNQQISRLELGQRKLTVEWLISISEALKVAETELYERTTPTTRTKGGR